jgi:squalene monooxygenase
VPLTVDCSGCFSKFRAQLSRAKPMYSSHFVALLLRDVALPYTDYGYVTLADPAPVLMYAIASNELRVLVAVPDPLPSTSNGDLERYLCTHVAPQLPPFAISAFQAAVAEVRCMHAR